MAFVEFQGKPRERQSGVFASIGKQGTIRLSRACYERHFKGKDHVIFLYDNQAQRIGLKPANNKAGNAHPIRSTDTQPQVSAIGFLRHFKIPFGKESVRLAGEWDDKQGVVVLESFK